MKPSFHWLWFCGICYAIGMDAVWATATTLTCSCGKTAVPPTTCDLVCGGGGTVIGGKLCACEPTKYTLLVGSPTYEVVKPDFDAAEECSDCTYTTTYACVAGYYLETDGETCERCPNNLKSADKNSGGITDCYAPADTTFAKDGHKFKYMQNCYYSKSAAGNDLDSESTTTTTS